MAEARLFSRAWPSGRSVQRKAMALRRPLSWYCDGQTNRPRNGGDWKSARALAYRVDWGGIEDPTDGALWYHADYVKPAWRRRLHRGPKIGAHIFYWDEARD